MPGSDLRAFQFGIRGVHGNIPIETLADVSVAPFGRTWRTTALYAECFVVNDAFRHRRSVSARAVKLSSLSFRLDQNGSAAVRLEISATLHHGCVGAGNLLYLSAG